jgi:prepilin-type N-terminal cleavage/methylation domain-containing protein
MTRRSGFTLMEILAVLTVIAVMTAVVVPRIRVTPSQLVQQSARQLVRDLELVRTKSLAMRRNTRVAFHADVSGYTAYLDHDADGRFTEDATEREALRAFGTRTFASGVTFGRGAAPVLPGESDGAAVTFPDARVAFDRRGLPTPFGARGAVYVTHVDDVTQVWAVQLSGAGGIRVWRFRDGRWE